MTTTAPVWTAGASDDVPQQGGFCWDVARDDWGWSGSLYRLHGYQPGDVRPTTAVTLGHKHPDDLHGCVDALHAGMVGDQVVVHEHRLLDRRGFVVPVVMVARPAKDALGAVTHVRGFLVPTEAGRLGPDDVDHHRTRTALLQKVFGIERAAARVLATRTLPL